MLLYSGYDLVVWLDVFCPVFNLSKLIGNGLSRRIRPSFVFEFALKSMQIVAFVDACFLEWLTTSIKLDITNNCYYLSVR